MASVIARAVNQSGNGAIQPELLEEIQNRVKVYKLNNPKSKAVDLGIVDQYRQSIEDNKTSMLQEQVYGDRTLTPRDAAATIRSLEAMLRDPMMDDMQRQSIYAALQGVLYKSGMLTPGAMGPMPSQNQTQGTSKTAVDALKEALDRLK